MTRTSIPHVQFQMTLMRATLAIAKSSRMPVPMILSPWAQDTLPLAGRASNLTI